MMNIENCPICGRPMNGRWKEIGAWQATTAIKRVFDGWECTSGCDQGARGDEWLKEIQKRRGDAT
jgi:hypothetical protein